MGQEGEQRGEHRSQKWPSTWRTNTALSAHMLRMRCQNIFQWMTTQTAATPQKSNTYDMCWALALRCATQDNHKISTFIAALAALSLLQKYCPNNLTKNLIINIKNCNNNTSVTLICYLYYTCCATLWPNFTDHNRHDAYPLVTNQTSDTQLSIHQSTNSYTGKLLPHNSLQ